MTLGILHMVPVICTRTANYSQNSNYGSSTKPTPLGATDRKRVTFRHMPLKRGPH